MTWHVCAQLCLALCNFMDYSSPGSSVYGFFRQEYQSGLPFPSLGNLRDTGIEPVSLMSLALAGRFFTTCATWEALYVCIYIYSFLYSFPLWFITGYRMQFPVLYSRTLSIHPIYSGLYLLIPDSTLSLLHSQLRSFFIQNSFSKPVVLSGGNLTPKDVWQCLEQFWLSHLWRRYWHLVDRDQGCC